MTSGPASRTMPGRRCALRLVLMPTSSKPDVPQLMVGVGGLEPPAAAPLVGVVMLLVVNATEGLEEESLATMIPVAIIASVTLYSAPAIVVWGLLASPPRPSVDRAPPGWYQIPGVPAQQRYWDGHPMDGCGRPARASGAGDWSGSLTEPRQLRASWRHRPWTGDAERPPCCISPDRRNSVSLLVDTTQSYVLPDVPDDRNTLAPDVNIC